MLDLRPTTDSLLSRPRCGSMGLLILGLGALSSCDRGTNSQVAEAPRDALSNAQRPSNDALSPDELAALRDEVKRSLRAELRDEVAHELRRELRPTETAAVPAPTPRDTPDATVSDVAVAPGIPIGPDGQGDPWSQPGTRIWPTSGGLKLVELVVGTALEDKLPVDIQPHYPIPPEILYCYTVFENPEADTTVTHVWRRGNRLVSRVELSVGRSPKWRTWSKQRTQPHWTGLWSCEVLDQNGQQLGLHVFQIGG